MKVMDYCPHCRRRTPHIHDVNVKLCKRCGRKSKRLNLINFKL